MIILSVIKMFDVFVFLGLLYVLLTLQYVLTYLDSIENIQILFRHYFYIYEEKINSFTVIKFSLSK